MDVSTADFTRDPAKFMSNSKGGEIVRVHDGERVIGAFVPEDFLLDYERLKRREREVLRSEDLSDADAEAITAAKYGVAVE